MSTDEPQQGPPTGSVAHAFRNRLFWHWAPAMPKGIPAGFVAALYALGSASDPVGKVRFRDGKAITIKHIAAACKSDEKDARRYINAAMAAGVVGVQGEQRRGRASLYVLILDPNPDWGAALSSLGASKRKRPERKEPPWRDGKNGGPPPELPDTEFGGPPPELEQDPDEKVRGTAPRMSSGDRPPFGSGDRPPYIPGVIHDSSHDGAEVVVKAEVVGPTAVEQIGSNQDNDQPATANVVGFARCTTCHERLIPDPRRPDRTTHTHCAERNTA